MISKEPSEPWQVWTGTPTDAAILYRTLVRDQALPLGYEEASFVGDSRHDSRRRATRRQLWISTNGRSSCEYWIGGPRQRRHSSFLRHRDLPRGSCHAFSGRSTSTETEDAERVRWVTWQISWLCPPLPWETFPGRSQETLPC